MKDTRDGVEEIELSDADEAALDRAWAKLERRWRREEQEQQRIERQMQDSPAPQAAE